MMRQTSYKKKILNIFIIILFIIIIILKSIPRMPRDIFQEISPFFSLLYWFLFFTNGFLLSLTIIKNFIKEQKKETFPLIGNILPIIKEKYMKISRNFYESFANDPSWVPLLIWIYKKYSTISNHKIVLLILSLRIILILTLVYDVIVLGQLNYSYKTFFILLLIIFNKIGIRITTELNDDMIQSISSKHSRKSVNYVRLKYKRVKEKINELVNLLNFPFPIEITFKLIYTIVWGYIVFYYPLNIVSILLKLLYIFAIKSSPVNYKIIMAIAILLLYIKK